MPSDVEIFREVRLFPKATWTWSLTQPEFTAEAAERDQPAWKEKKTDPPTVIPALEFRKGKISCGFPGLRARRKGSQDPLHSTSY